MKVRRVTEVKISRSPVYDIEVPATSNFMLSSGVIVHNSKDLADAWGGSFYHAAKYHEKKPLFSITKYQWSEVYTKLQSMVNKTVAKMTNINDSKAIYDRLEDDMFGSLNDKF